MGRYWHYKIGVPLCNTLCSEVSANVHNDEEISKTCSSEALPIG